VHDEYCPGLTEEVQGVADSLRLPFRKRVLRQSSANRAGMHHAVALPGITANHHLLMVGIMIWRWPRPIFVFVLRIEGQTQSPGLLRYVYKPARPSANGCGPLKFAGILF
jgi:hypothetical protein